MEPLGFSQIKTVPLHLGALKTAIASIIDLLLINS